jgi:hypothetical protein
VLAIPLIAYVVLIAYFTADLRFDSGFSAGIALLYSQSTRAALAYGAFAQPGPAGIGVSVVLWLLLIFTFFAPSAAIAQRAFQSMLGRAATFDNCIALTLAALPRLVVFAVLMFLSYGIVALVLGDLFLQIAWPDLALVPTFIVALLAIVATMFLSVVWWVGIPVLMAEWASPFRALHRSWVLTRGKRWHIVAVLVLLAVPDAAIQAILASYMPADTSAAASEILATALVVAGGVVGVFFYFVHAAAAAIGYFHLAGEKEGILALDRIIP